jgi:hypothetical protein
MAEMNTLVNFAAFVGFDSAALISMAMASTHQIRTPKVTSCDCPAKDEKKEPSLPGLLFAVCFRAARLVR